MKLCKERSLLMTKYPKSSRPIMNMTNTKNTLVIDKYGVATVEKLETSSRHLRNFFAKLQVQQFEFRFSKLMRIVMYNIGMIKAMLIQFTWYIS